MDWKHGGDWAGFELEYGAPPLDFSANVSPLGAPEGVKAALRDAAGRVDRYPDPFCRALRDALAERENVPAGQIVCGNGAADLIYRIVWALRPRRALAAAPTFSEYGAALRTAGCTVVSYPLKRENEFRLGADFLEFITPETDAVFLCEPNNPTGLTTPRPLLLKILERCRNSGTWLIADECFNDFLDEPEEHSLRPWLTEFPNLLILKAFTKLYAMAGVRLGYVLSQDESLPDALREAGPPWNVSTLAQAAGAAALRETAYVRRLRRLIQAERPRLLEGLRQLGLEVIPGEANYLLFQSQRPLVSPLRERGILLRSCANYEGLDETWYRTAVRTQEENQRLLTALKEVFL